MKCHDSLCKDTSLTHMQYGTHDSICPHMSLLRCMSFGILCLHQALDQPLHRTIEVLV